MKQALFAAVVLSAFAGAAQAEFELKFAGWGGIPLCTNGSPNNVGSPEFSLRGLPEGTTSVQLRLKDLNAPNYNHGGSKKLSVSQDGVVVAGTFKYKSPCLPDGVHTYQWTATARKGGKVLARATSSRKYPD